MKILYIHHSGLIGGAGVSVTNTVLALSKRCHVVLYVPDNPSDMLEYLQERCKGSNVSIISYSGRIGAITYYSGGDGVFSPRLWYRALLTISQRRYWNNVIAEHKPDTVIVNSKVLCWMSSLPVMHKTKSICYIRETIAGNRKNLLNQWITRKLDDFDCCIFISDYDREHENLHWANAFTIYNYVDENQFDVSITRYEASRKLGLDSNSFHVLYVGGVSEMKGFDLVLQAVLHENANGVELLVCGNDFDEAMNTKNKQHHTYVQKWRDVLEQADRKDRIHVFGRQKDMSAFYAVCDVIVFPMRSPHQARPVIEAGIFGKPVIITDFENIREFVNHGYNGFLVPCNDVESLNASIVQLRDDVRLREKIGANNHANTQEKHDRQKSIDAVIRIVEDICSAD